jgi:riboflavin kinase
MIGGNVKQFTGVVSDGAGQCSQRLTKDRYGKGLKEELDYQPYPGSLNVRLSYNHNLINEQVAWVGEYKNTKADYQFWRAWIGDRVCHAMVPGNRGWRNVIEVVASSKLRDTLKVKNGDIVNVDVEIRGG